jgi:hypothetical protein
LTDIVYQPFFIIFTGYSPELKKIFLTNLRLKIII